MQRSLSFVLNALEGLTHHKTQLTLLLSSSVNYFHFEKYLLAWYWALVETECLSMGHHITM